MLTQLLWDVVLQVSGHEELEALIVDGLHGEGDSLLSSAQYQKRALHHGLFSFLTRRKDKKTMELSVQVDLP